MMSAIEARHAKMPAYRDGDLPAGVADFFVPGDPEEAQLTDIVGLVGVNKLLLTCGQVAYNPGCRGKRRLR
jgi:hypothetical protein